MQSSDPRIRLAEQIERAFGDVTYPGDDRIVQNPHDLESVRLRDEFKGKHWTTLPLRTLLKYSSSLPLLTPEAVRFYLPAFLHVSVVRPDEVDVIPENIISYLTPPEGRPESSQWFQDVLAGLSPPQVTTIQEFFRQWFSDVPPSFVLESDKRAKSFWLDSGGPQASRREN